MNFANINLPLILTVSLGFPGCILQCLGQKQSKRLRVVGSILKLKRKREVLDNAQFYSNRSTILRVYRNCHEFCPNFITEMTAEKLDEPTIYFACLGPKFVSFPYQKLVTKAMVKSQFNHLLA